MSAVSADIAVRTGAVPARALLLALSVVGLVAGFAFTGETTARQAMQTAGPELAWLLRMMAAMKLLAAAGALAVVTWRLAVPVGPARLAGYALAGAAMLAGPGLIWRLAHVGLGALLLHGGLLVTVLLLWRDPAMGARLSALLAARHARRAG